MSISAVARESLPTATGMTWAAFLGAQSPEIVLGAFTGAIIFLLSQSNKPKWQWLLLFTVALMTGLLGASTMSAIAGGAIGLIGIKVTVPHGMGAMASAACTVNVITWLRDNAGRILGKRTGVNPGAAE